MKKIIIILWLPFAFFAKAQENRNSIALNYGIGNGTLSSLRRLVGTGSFEGKSLTNIGISIFDKSSKNLYFETGLHFITFKYKSTSPFYGHGIIVNNHKLNLISIPLKLKYEAGKYVFFNGGMYVDIDVSNKNTGTKREFSGLGAGLGIGFQYYFNNNLSIYTNPQIDLRNLVSFSGGINKLIASNLTFGVAYRIK